MKSKILLLLMCTSFGVGAQDSILKRNAISTIQNFHHAEQIMSLRRDLEVVLMTYSEIGNYKNKAITDSEVGTIHSYSNNDSIGYHFKVLYKGSDEFCKVQYISLDGKKHHPEEIDEIRKKDKKAYTEGVDFSDLIAKYNEGVDSTGESGWFLPDTSVFEFDRQVWHKKKGEIFDVNVEYRNRYYVVLKTEKNKLGLVVKGVEIEFCKKNCNRRKAGYLSSDFDSPYISEQPEFISSIKASFKGGEEGVKQFINDNIVYPEEAIKNKEQGTVHVSFVVEPDGSLFQIRIDKGVSELLDQEALRVVALMKDWSPGQVGGKVVRSKIVQPIVFVLE